MENCTWANRMLYVWLGLLLALPMRAQMLFTENMTMAIDSTKTIQGSLQPVVDFKTEKENVLTLKNTTNLNLLINRNRVVNLISDGEWGLRARGISLLAEPCV